MKINAMLNFNRLRELTVEEEFFLVASNTYEKKKLKKIQAHLLIFLS